jgi:lysophospholipase L1-like esterase
MPPTADPQQPTPRDGTAGAAPAPVRARRPRRFWRMVLAANALALLVLLVLGEVAVRMWREGGVWAGLRSFGNASPLSRGGADDAFVPDDARGYALAPGRNGVNALHVRHGELASPKPAGAFRLLVIGDSVAWPADGFVALLAASLPGRLPSVEVINAAVPGYTSYQQRRHLELLAPRVEPDLVVVQYCCNDNHRFLHQLGGDGGWLLTEEARRALVPEGGGPIDALCRWSYLALEIRRSLFGLGKRGSGGADGAFAWQHDAAFAAAWRDDSWPLVDEQYAAIAATCRACGTALAVVAVPYEPQLADAARARDAEYARKPQAWLRALCERLAVPLLDVHDDFLAARDRGLYSDGIHLTAAGHALLAARLEAFLLAARLLPAR